MRQSVGTAARHTLSTGAIHEPSHTTDSLRALRNRNPYRPLVVGFTEGGTSVAKILWVAPHCDEWWVTRDGGTGAEAIFDARETAIDWACRVARLRSPCLVRVQDHRGNVAAQFAFEDTRSPAAA